MSAEKYHSDAVENPEEECEQGKKKSRVDLGPKTVDDIQKGNCLHDRRIHPHEAQSKEGKRGPFNLGKRYPLSGEKLHWI